MASIRNIKLLSTVFLSTLFAPLAEGQSAKSASFDHSHFAFIEVLERAVTDDSFVHYDKLMKSPDALQSYLDVLGKVNSKRFETHFSRE